MDCLQEIIGPNYEISKREARDIREIKRILWSREKEG